MIIKENKGLDYYSYLVIIFLLLQIAMPWVCVTSTSRPLALTHHSSVVAAAAAAYQQPGAGLEQSRGTSEIKNGVEANILKGDESDKVMRMEIGSSPPNCEYKCYGCTPCQPTQVPTSRARAGVGIQYANYEPEGWRCQCGPSFYTP